MSDPTPALQDVLMAHLETVSALHKAAFEQGFAKGYQEGFAAARQIVDQHFKELIERVSK